MIEESDYENLKEYEKEVDKVISEEQNSINILKEETEFDKTPLDIEPQDISMEDSQIIQSKNNIIQPIPLKASSNKSNSIDRQTEKEVSKEDKHSISSKESLENPSSLASKPPKIITTQQK